MKQSILHSIALIVLQGLSVASLAGHSTGQIVTSPDGKLTVDVELNASGGITYALEAYGTKLVSPSAMGLDFGSAGKIPGAGWSVVKTGTRAVDSTWKPVWGKRAVVPDRYHEAILELTGSGAPFDQMSVAVRAYDDGIAFRYLIPAGAKGRPAKAVGDRAEYNFAGDFTAWFYNGENANLGPDKLSAIKGVRMPVMTLRAAGDAFLAVHEADLRAGEPLRLTKSGSTGFCAKTAPGEIAPGYEGPWRVIFFGTTPGVMVDSHLIELLNPDPAGDFSWVKPGVAVWDWRVNGAVADGFKYTMSLPSWLRMVDFAAENGMKYLVLDANWYGPEFAQNSDPVKGDKVNDVKKIIAYGKAKNIGVWVYLNDVGGRKFPIEQTLAQYGEWGAAGVKYGFMHDSPKDKNARTRLITELCAQHRLLCDFHDGPVHPYGQLRTWPNAVTREFCHSQLDGHHVFVPKTFVTTVFVNMLSGPLDMNNGLADLTQAGRVDQPSPVPSTLTGEAARTLIVFSGATVIPDIPENYKKHPELLKFIAAEQMPWRESKTLSGAIGEHIVMARQAANGTWLVGAATNEEARDLDIPLSFLPEGKYEALVIQDGDDSDYRTHAESYKAAKQPVTSATTLHVKLAPGGGACVLLTAVSK